ncbi:MAG: hypothetical protein Q4C56_06495 [Peptococcaceae bacterium]|nr:hypothetical protein [Peptococcaceae bacterium]
MSGKAFLLTQRRLTDDHYLQVALREARDMHKPPITMSNFWKHADNYDDPSEQLADICKWLDNVAEIGDYVVLDGNDDCVKTIAAHAKDHRLVPVRAIWEPDIAIRDL